MISFLNFPDYFDFVAFLKYINVLKYALAVTVCFPSLFSLGDNMSQNGDDNLLANGFILNLWCGIRNWDTHIFEFGLLFVPTYRQIRSEAR